VKVLGFDTATSATSVALTDGDGAGHGVQRLHLPAPGERPGHATHLLGMLEEVLAAASTGWEDVERLVVGTGPGTFTGLRIGIATARALAQARGLPLLGASTLRVLAAAAQASEPGPGRPVFAVIDARRGEAFAAGWHAEEELFRPAALAPSALAQRVRALRAAPLAVGDGAVRFRDQLAQAGASVPEDDSPLHTVNAAFHCLRSLRVEPSAAGDVLPDYVRLPDAELARRRASEPAP